VIGISAMILPDGREIKGMGSGYQVVGIGKWVLGIGYQGVVIRMFS